MRYLVVFLDDATDVPAEVVDYPSEQLGVAEPSVLKTDGPLGAVRPVAVAWRRRVRRCSKSYAAWPQRGSWA
jgi:hypothetical protein